MLKQITYMIKQLIYTNDSTESKSHKIELVNKRPQLRLEGPNRSTVSPVKRFALVLREREPRRWNSQPTQVTQPKLEDPNQKSISKTGVAKLSSPRLSWSDLNEMIPNYSHGCRRPGGGRKTTTPKL